MENAIIDSQTNCILDVIPVSKIFTMKRYIDLQLFQMIPL